MQDLALAQNFSRYSTDQLLTRHFKEIKELKNMQSQEIKELKNNFIALEASVRMSQGQSSC